MHPGEEEPVWASLSRDSVTLMLVARSPHSKLEHAAMTGSLYLYPENVDEAWAELNALPYSTDDPEATREYVPD